MEVTYKGKSIETGDDKYEKLAKLDKTARIFSFPRQYNNDNVFSINSADSGTNTNYL